MKYCAMVSLTCDLQEGEKFVVVATDPVVRIHYEDFEKGCHTGARNTKDDDDWGFDLLQKGPAGQRAERF